MTNDFEIVTTNKLNGEIVLGTILIFMGNTAKQSNHH